MNLQSYPLCALLALAPLARAIGLAIFEDKNFDGFSQATANVYATLCYKPDPKLDRKVSSYRVYGGCCAFYRESGCVSGPGRSASGARRLIWARPNRRARRCSPRSTARTGI